MPVLCTLLLLPVWVTVACCRAAAECSGAAAAAAAAVIAGAVAAAAVADTADVGCTACHPVHLFQLHRCTRLHMRNALHIGSMFAKRQLVDRSEWMPTRCPWRHAPYCRCFDGRRLRRSPAVGSLAESLRGMEHLILQVQLHEWAQAPLSRGLAAWPEGCVRPFGHRGAET